MIFLPGIFTNQAIDDGPLPIGCVITLTGDIVAVVGGQPLDISGQTVSKTVGESVTVQEFGAGGPAVPLWSEGTRAIGYQASQFTDDVTVETLQGLALSSDDLSEGVGLSFSWNYTPGISCWAISTHDGEEILATQTDPFSKVALRIDGATGDVEAIIDGDVYDKSTIPWLAGLFTKPLFPAVWFTHRLDPTVYEATVYTYAADLASFDLPAGTLDWCGNEIPVTPPAPSCSITLTGDIAALLGVQALLVTNGFGEATLSTPEDPEYQQYVASSNVAAPLSIDWPEDEIRWIGQFPLTEAVDSSSPSFDRERGVMFGLLALSGSLRLAYLYSELLVPNDQDTRRWKIILASELGGTYTVVTLQDKPPFVAVGYDGAGNVYIFDGENVHKHTPDSELAKTGLMLGAQVYFDGGSGTGVSSAKVVTDADLFPVALPSVFGITRHADLCGNEIPVTPPAPSCVITLTHDGLDAFGPDPMDVSGQTLSVTGDGISEYGMWTGAAGKPVDWDGVRIVAKKIITNPVTGYTSLNLVKPDFSLRAKISWSQWDGEWYVETGKPYSEITTGFAKVGGAVTDRPALGVDGATGDVTVYLNGVVVADKTTLGTYGHDLTDLGGMFATDNVIVFDVAGGLMDGETYSAEIITQFDKYEDEYPAGTKDWCGNEIPVTPPAPSCSITLTGDIADALAGQPLDISGQVVSKTVPESPVNAYVAGSASTLSGWSGWRAVGYQASDFTTAGNSEHALRVVNSARTAYVSLFYSNEVGNWFIFVGGATVGAIPGNAASKAGVRIDGSSGDVEVSVDGVVRTKANYASLGGLLSGDSIFPMAILGRLTHPTLTEGDTYSAQIFTAAEDLADLGFPAGTLDWCGNEITVTPPAPSCSITLSSDILHLFGGQPLDISGQTVSKTTSESPDMKYFSAASYYSGQATPPLWSEGTRAIGYQASQFTETDGVNLETEQLLYLLSEDFFEAVILGFSESWLPGSPNCWYVNWGGGTDFLETQTDPLSKVAILVDGATGDAAIVIDGNVYDKSTIPGLAGKFTKPIYPVVEFRHRGDPTVYEATVYTYAADLASFDLPAGTLDWCGNEIPVADSQFSYRLNASEQLIDAFYPGYEKLIPSADEQTGTLELAFSGSDHIGAMIGKLTSEDPLVPDPLHDMSYGTGDFVYEIHASFPSVSGPLDAQYVTAVALIDSNANEVIPSTGVFLPTGETIPATPEKIGTLRFWDDDENEVKMLSLFLDGEHLEDVEIEGDLSTPVVYMVIAEPSGSVGDHASFDDENPSISVRFVTDPAEMVYAASVLPRPAKTVVGDGEVIPVVIPVPSDPISILGDKLVAWYTSDPATLFTTSTGDTAVAAAGDPVGLRVNQVSGGPNAIQTTASSRPLWQTGPDRIVYDGSNDSLRVTVPAGGWTGTFFNATTQGVIVGTYSVPAGTYQLPTIASYPKSLNNDVGIILCDDVASPEEIVDVVQWLKANVGAGSGVYVGSQNLSSFFRGRTDITSLDGSTLDFSAGTNFQRAWLDCTGLTTFPLLDVSSGTNFSWAWNNCSGLTSFPALDVSSGTNFQQAWQYCTGLTTFPLLDVSSGTNFSMAWSSCSGLTSFPLLDVSSGTNFYLAWNGCSGLTSFPLLDVSSGTNFSMAWASCSGLTSFPLLDVSSGTDFYGAWQDCTGLTTFPAAMFDGCTATSFANAFVNTNLTQTSIDNILVSINSNGTSNGYFDQSGGSAPSATGEAAIDAMRARGWTVYVTGGY